MLNIDRERAKLVKRVRSEVRLRHSIAADDELAEILPRLQAEFDAGLQAGKLLELQPGTLSFYVESDGR